MLTFMKLNLKFNIDRRFLYGQMSVPFFPLFTTIVKSLIVEGFIKQVLINITVHKLFDKNIFLSTLKKVFLLAAL